MFDFCSAGPGPGLGSGAVKNPPQFHAKGQSANVENVHQLKKLMEQEMKSDKSSNNKGYVFTLMPIYAISVGLFAAYKFLKVFVLPLHCGDLSFIEENN